MLVTSRSYDEYVAMFGLVPDDLSGRLLDCCAGAADFVATGATRGLDAVAVDPAYVLSPAELAGLGRADLDRGGAIAAAHPDRFTWGWYGSSERRDEMRARALATFLLDRVDHPRRYVAGRLPALPFRDTAFSLALCSHLLFTWADELGHEWHRAAIVELARVASEVRIFPTVVQGTGDPVPFWGPLLDDLGRAGLRAVERRADYEFQVGADRMLVVTR